MKEVSISPLCKKCGNSLIIKEYGRTIRWEKQSFFNCPHRCNGHNFSTNKATTCPVCHHPLIFVRNKGSKDYCSNINCPAYQIDTGDILLEDNITSLSRIHYLNSCPVHYLGNHELLITDKGVSVLSFKSYEFYSFLYDKFLSIFYKHNLIKGVPF